MKAIILAAGKGSRLGYPDMPKPLTLLSTGQSILGYQIAELKKHLKSEELIVVVGYRKEKIIEAFPDLHFVVNPDFAVENTSKSLLCALKTVHEDLVWLNGDVVFHPSVLDTLFSHKKTALIANQGPCGEEEVKYRLNSRGQVAEISKTVQHPLGESLGLHYLEKKHLALLIQQLERCAPTDYFEKALDQSIHEGMEVDALCIDSDLCTEIDFPEDLARANSLLLSWPL